MFFLVSCPKRSFESTIEIMHRFFLPTVQYLDRQENLINYLHQYPVEEEKSFYKS